MDLVLFKHFVESKFVTIKNKNGLVTFAFHYVHCKFGIEVFVKNMKEILDYFHHGEKYTITDCARAQLFNIFFDYITKFKIISNTISEKPILTAPICLIIAYFTVFI